MKKILLIPDVHCRPGSDLSYLANIGKLAVEKKPDIIVNIGDFADMPSLSSYDVGKKSFEGRRYINDIQSALDGMEILLSPIKAFNEEAKKNHKTRYKPRQVLLLGNHENRLLRAVNDDPKLEGILGVRDLRYEESGWEVYPFLEVVNVEGIMFSHYFTSGVMGRPVSSARLMLQKKHCSCVQGHVQHRDIAYSHTADGRELVGLFCGTAYKDHHEYLGNQGQDHFRGVWILKNVADGSFEPVAYTLDELDERYKD